MLASLARILVLIALGFGAYKLYPHYQPLVQKQLDNPAVLGAAVDPLINSVNKVLPESIQIPQTNPTPSSSNQETTNKTPEAVQKIFDEVKVKTGEVAQEQLEVIKKEASKQFCSVLLEKIKTECGNL